MLEHREAVRTALAEVAEHSFFASTDPLKESDLLELAAGVPAWLQTTVRFDGAFGGCLTTVLAEPLARELFVRFLGEPPDMVPADGPLFDLAGELGNMVCGLWLTRACQRRRFDLRHPEVVRLGAPGAFDPSADLAIGIDGQPAIVRLSFDEA